MGMSGFSIPLPLTGKSKGARTRTNRAQPNKAAYAVETFFANSPTIASASKGVLKWGKLCVYVRACTYVFPQFSLILALVCAY